MSAQAQLRLHGTVAVCGGTIMGDVSWWGNGARRPVGVDLRYRTEGRGDTDAAVVSRWVLGDGDAGQGRFRLDVPPDGPVTYHGQLMRLLWQVGVTVPGTFRWGWRPVVVADLVVAPRGWLPE